MAWTTPKTDWTTGELVAASDLNAIGDTDNFLFNGWAGDRYVRNNGSNWTTTSTSYVDVDATNLASTITTNGGDVLVIFTGNVQNSAVAGCRMALDIDGTTTEAITLVNPYNTGKHVNMSFAYLITGLSAGSHTIKLRWRNITASTMTLVGSEHVSWVVREVAGAS